MAIPATVLRSLSKLEETRALMPHLAGVALAGVVLARRVTIHNDVPRRDVDGNILNAHDGAVVQFTASTDAPNTGFFMYGTVYENCTQSGPQCVAHATCGYVPNRYSLYHSPDMIEWTLRSDNIMPSVAVDNSVINYWMPNVFFNPLTNKYVMQFWSSHCGFHQKCAEIALADTPDGPFVPTATPLQLHDGAIPSSTMGLWIDPDSPGDAYIKYNTFQDSVDSSSRQRVASSGHPKDGKQHHVIEKLAPDWLSTLPGTARTIFWKPSFPWFEGGGLLKRAGIFYYTTGSDCCFCEWGGDVRYWSAHDALGPWHPGLAPPLPAAACDLAGVWHLTGVNQSGVVHVTEKRGTFGNFSYAGPNASGIGWVEQATGYVHSSGEAKPGVVTSADGRDAGCDRVRWYGYEDLSWCRAGSSCPTLVAPELNPCLDGTAPVFGGATHNVPCIGHGERFKIPAQQFNNIHVRAATGGEDTWMFYGERSKSAPDGFKSHNAQAWVPFTFAKNGELLPFGDMPETFALEI